jgi:hypothetical protein
LGCLESREMNECGVMMVWRLERLEL